MTTLAWSNEYMGFYKSGFKIFGESFCCHIFLIATKGIWKFVLIQNDQGKDKQDQAQ